MLGGGVRYAEIKYCDIANGVGCRTSLFVSGCTHACPGCFNEIAWDFSYGEELDEAVEDKIVESLRPAYVSGLTLIGGEPMEPANQRGLVRLAERVRSELPGKTIWCYTGDVLEELLDPESPRRTEVTDRLLACIDVLVDGPWVSELHDITLRFRGSSNQRLIDLPKTIAEGAVVPWEDERIYATRGSI